MKNMKTNIVLSEQPEFSNRKIDIPNTYTYDRSLSLFGTDTSVKKNGGVNLVK